MEEKGIPELFPALLGIEWGAASSPTPQFTPPTACPMLTENHETPPSPTPRASEANVSQNTVLAT